MLLILAISVYFVILFSVRYEFFEFPRVQLFPSGLSIQGGDAQAHTNAHRVS